eukprot:TRINITY_DN95002_c0_g1_i1.p1 TRINITY_DN95002_c0_g1~~TRINITY_DN95002_c0_g1_i1.p1  ORF type:complete len:327 (+),score=88.98 TRINITY_DN95002_c0_g1_i1:46-981(+)
MLRRRRSESYYGKLLRLAVLAVALAWLCGEFSASRGTFCNGGVQRRTSRRQAARRASTKPQALQGSASLQLIQAQSSAGHKMKEVGTKLEKVEFKASALDGRATVTFDGLQNLRDVEIADDALATAGSSSTLAEALLGALQEGHDSSTAGSEQEAWGLYRDNPELMQAPLTQIGAGDTVEDLWANISRTEESLQLAEELFHHFDKDQDGYWNLKETSEVQLATEGTEMAEEAFNSLIIAAAPDGGRKLTEEDMAKGLSKEQLIDLYTNAQRQRQLGFVLNIYKDHATVFGKEPDKVGADAATTPAPPPALD